MLSLPEKIFITGTDTDVGKTVISALLVLGLRAKYWKPIQSGTEEGTDAQKIQNMTGQDEEYFLPEVYKLKAPLSPHLAARLEGISIDIDRIVLPETQGPLIVEGAGGVMVPVNEEQFMLDLMQRLALPVLVVARSTLGTINHTLLTIDKLRRARVEILGVVLNGPQNIENKKAIEKYGKVNVLAEVEPLPELTPQGVQEAFRRCFGGKGENALSTPS
jgi:dethiobiotin synthase